MRILFVGADPVGSNGAAADLMESHVVATLREMGHECLYFPYRTAVLGARLNRVVEHARSDFGWIDDTPVDRALRRVTAACEPDLVLTLLGNYTPPQAIAAVRSVTKAPLACWCQDHMGTLGRQSIIASGYDFVFAKDRAMVRLLHKFTSLSVHYLPEACNPAVHRPIEPSTAQWERYGCDVTTAATLYYFRSAILESIAEFDLKIWGSVPRFYRGPLRARHAGGFVHADEKAACFRASRIVLNTLFPTEIDGVNARAFEAAGCGGFQLIMNSPAVGRYFEVGREIAVFDDLTDLRDKVVHYLRHGVEREAIAEAGRRRAHREHTYRARLDALLDTVFGTGVPAPVEVA